MKLLSNLSGLWPAVAQFGSRRDGVAADVKQSLTRHVWRGAAALYALVVVVVSLLPAEQLVVWVPIAQDEGLNAGIREAVVEIAGVAGLVLVVVPVLLHVLRVRIWVAPRLRLSRTLSLALIVYVICLALIASESLRAAVWDGTLVVFPSWLGLVTRNLSACHFMAYSGLALLLVLGWGWRLEWWLIGFLALVLGGVLELLQGMVPGRIPEWWDLLSDGLGILMGLIAGRVFMLQPRSPAQRVSARSTRITRDQPSLTEADRLIEAGWDAFRAGQAAEQFGDIAYANEAYRQATRAAASALRIGAHGGVSLLGRPSGTYYLYGQASLGSAKTSILLGNHSDKALHALRESELALQDTLRLVDHEKLVDSPRWRGSRGEALIALGMVYLLQERPDDAGAVTSEALRLAPGDLNALRLAGVLDNAKRNSPSSPLSEGHSVLPREPPGVVEIARVLLGGWNAVGGTIAKDVFSSRGHDNGVSALRARPVGDERVFPSSRHPTRENVI